MPNPSPRIELPDPPSEQESFSVKCWREPLRIATYDVEAAPGFPAYLDRRVYQGSSGRVYPLPFHERVADSPTMREWDAVHLQNEFLHLVVLPELGGRIHIAVDRVAGVDMFYRNNVIKPALVGLTGPWISGGIEFNWPQHHRPGTYLPTDVAIERESDGAVTVWCSDHDPFARMKGMHGVSVRPDSAALEVRVRLFNRAETRQSFLWWANVAVPVTEDTQTVLPQDVRYVADHARRAVVSYPVPDEPYYGVDYSAREPNEPHTARLDWAENIPVPSSFMALSSKEEFIGVFHHDSRSGFIHWASRDVSPGKKQWTWGNEEFGRAWERNLTDEDGPYIELMAGVYTDNQPDFAFLEAGETKAFSQFWYPVHIGPVQQASRYVALTTEVRDEMITLSVEAPEPTRDASAVLLDQSGEVVHSWSVDLAPSQPLQLRGPVDGMRPPASVTIVASDGRELARHDLLIPSPVEPERPAPAVAPPPPGDVRSVDELVHIAIYLDQYRHASRSSTPYWEEALRRDPAESRATEALGAAAYSRAEFDKAEDLLRSSVARRTAFAPTPSDGGAHYRLGLTLARRGELDGAADALGRAAWDVRYRSAAGFALGQVHARAGQEEKAIGALERVLQFDPAHHRAACLLAVLLRDRGEHDRASALITAVLAVDPLDQWALHLAGRATTRDAGTMLDVSIEYSTVGRWDDALSALNLARGLGSVRTPGEVALGPLIAYHRASVLWDKGDLHAAATAAHEARSRPHTHCLPSRLEDVLVLRTAQERWTDDPLPPALLGHWYYHAGLPRQAQEHWLLSIARGARSELAAVVHRNLGLAAFNVDGDMTAAVDHYRRARDFSPTDPKLLSEADQLDARRGVPAATRLATLRFFRDLVDARDDLSVAFADLLTETGDAAGAVELLRSRQFHPWEGGEGRVIGAWQRALGVLIREALARGEVDAALELSDYALRPPQNLGETYHPLASLADLWLIAGDAAAASGDEDRSKEYWEAAARATGDFTDMSNQQFGEQTDSCVMALLRLGRTDEAHALRERWFTWIEEVRTAPAEVDYFATSLPSTILFVADLTSERDALVSRASERLLVLDAELRLERHRIEPTSALGDASVPLRRHSVSATELA
ncbi:DUF5107 domain-containing protein [Microbacterium sp. NPDC057407]|uniref:DUF5107 domain-containing protein n=1 Tax=Microbacterium sp. NPDC057407 TaxID=3346120 RepID=UPI00366DA909